MSITEFLLARIGEDEAAANAAAESDPSKQANYMDEGPAGSKWTATDGMVSGQSGDLWDCEGSGTLCTSPEVAERFARHDPARVLAECKAKRALVALASGSAHEYNDDDTWYSCGLATGYYDDEPGSGCADDGKHGRCTCGLEVRVLAVLAPLAAIYADHPDYDPDWA